MRHIEMKNLKESYVKKLSKSKTSNSPVNVKLPKLIQNHSYHSLIIRKIEKLKALNYRNRYNSGERKVKAELSSLFSIHRIKNEFFKKILKEKNQKKIIFNKNNNNNLHNSFNSFTNNSISKTTVSNNGNNNNNNSIINKNNKTSKDFKTIKINNHYHGKNINNNNPNNKNSNNNMNINFNNNSNNESNNNKIKIIKIRQVENCKNNPEDNNKINTECGFIKKKYHINKNNVNKDIFKLINDDNNYLYFSKITKAPKIVENNAFSNNDEEKNEN